MIGVVIVAHEGIAREYLAALEKMVGRQEGMRAITIEPEHDRAAKMAEIVAAADAVDTGAGVLVVTDLGGSSPSNLSFPACAALNRCILSGLNMPLLIKLAKSRHLGMAEAVAQALDAGRKYINVIEPRRDQGV